MSEDTIPKFISLYSRAGEGRWLVPPELRDRLSADAEERNSNMTDVIITILSKRYGISVMPSVRRARQPADTHAPIYVNFPLPLYQAVAQAAAMKVRWSFQDEVRTALCEHYKLDAPGRARQAAAA